MVRYRNLLIYMVISFFFFLLIFVFFPLSHENLKYGPQCSDFVTLSEETEERKLEILPGKIHYLHIILSKDQMESQGKVYIRFLVDGQTVCLQEVDLADIEEELWIQKVIPKKAIRIKKGADCRLEISADADAAGKVRCGIAEDGIFVAYAEYASIAKTADRKILIVTMAVFDLLFCLIAVFMKKMSLKDAVFGGMTQAVIFFVQRALLIHLYQQNESLWSDRITFLLPAVVTAVTSEYFFLLFCLKEKIMADISRFFVACAVVLMAIYLFLFFPVSSNDSHTHIISSYRYSNFLLGYRENDGFTMRLCDLAFLRKFLTSDTAFDTPKSHEYKILLQSVTERTDPALRDTMGGADYMETEKRVTGIMPFSHLPFIIGITVGRLLKWNPFFTFYLGRVLSGLLYLLVLGSAIRITPVGKEIFAGIGLLPMCIMHAISYSQDGMVMLACTGLLANVLRLRFAELTEKEERHALFWTCFSAFFVGGVKGGVYLLTMPVVFMLADSKKGVKKALLTAITGVLSFGLVEGLLILAGGNVTSQINMRTLPNLTSFYAVEYPVRYLTKVVNTYLDYFDVFFGQSGGTHLAWNESVIPGYCIAGMFACICMWISYNPVKFKADVLSKWTILCALAAGFLLMPAATLIDTHIYWVSINGIQGRYYIPFLPLIFLLISGQMEKSRQSGMNAADQNVPETNKEGSLAIPAGSGTLFMILEVLSVFSILLLHFGR